MPGPATNLPVSDVEDTVDFFAKIYDQPVEVPQNVVDAIYAFFIDRTENKDSALALVNVTIVTALSSKINPMVMLDRLKETDIGTLDAQLAQFFNSTRNNTSTLGVKNVPGVNNHIARTILS